MTSGRAAKEPAVDWLPIRLSRSAVAVAPCSALICWVLTMKSVLVAAGSVAGKLPAGKLAGCATLDGKRAGQLCGSGGGCGCWARSTEGWSLDAPLYPVTPIVATPPSPVVMTTAASFESPRVVDVLPTGVEPTGVEPTGVEPTGTSCSVSDGSVCPLDEKPTPSSSIGV